MRYEVEGTFYELSYKDLREEYIGHVQMSNEEFLKNLPSALHIASVICWFKEIPTYVCLSDKGIIHELIHLLDCPEEPLVVLEDIRKLFEEQLKLA